MFSPQSEKKCVDSTALAHRVVRYDLLLHSNTRKLWDLSIRSTLCMTPFNATINQVSWATFLPLFFLDHHHHHLYFSGREEIYPLVPASISPFYWVFNCWRLGFQMLGHIVLLRGLFKKVNTWRNFCFFSSWNHACCFFCFLFCLPSFFSSFAELTL